jgi:hypothetical protein
MAPPRRGIPQDGSHPSYSNPGQIPPSATFNSPGVHHWDNVSLPTTFRSPGIHHWDHVSLPQSKGPNDNAGRSVTLPPFSELDRIASGAHPSSMDAMCHWAGCGVKVPLMPDDIQDHLVTVHMIGTKPRRPGKCLWIGCGERMDTDDLYQHVCDVHFSRHHPSRLGSSKLPGRKCKRHSKKAEIDANRRH